MNPQSMITTLKAFKLHGMAGTIEDLSHQASSAWQQAETVLETLLKVEVAERDVRSINYRMKLAKFPAYRDLASFDFTHSAVDEALIKALHRCEFINDTHNLVLVGGPGTGKTHLATAIAAQAIQHHRYRVRFISTIELVNALELEKQAGKQGRIANKLMYTDLVIFDELAYLLFSQAGGALLFHLISKLYECNSLIITTNLSFAGWAAVFGDAISPKPVTTVIGLNNQPNQKEESQHYERKRGKNKPA